MTTAHEITANIIVDPEMIGFDPNEIIRDPDPITHEFKNFSVTASGKLIVKNFSGEFRDKLAAVLMDETIPFDSTLNPAI